ncbi:hypothetical protein H6F46_16870 [Limnothrix sp. FACHB-1083]|uniref:hypothetical protein n=1 Tax=unclassified Limnothrix TaxID=2632864 RepID=UPI001680C895|nr:MULTISPECIES: hypothetical protein [unclassified Limnothrix]MBD2162364.1 hypothetical protein [Limnothrix sp. FACHB-1083]MBD2193411.1 hypothetical protein [Limnothrix sp. FACHB-1088]
MEAVRGSYIILHIRLGAIKNFLEHTDAEAGVEIQSVFEKYHAGEYEDIDDFDNALFYPMERQEMAARTVFYELNALSESELQRSAHVPWLESEKHSGPKALDWHNMTLNSIRSLKRVNDLPFKDILKLIENKYKIRVKDLEEADTFFQVREMVNSFKHREGYIDFRKQELKDIDFVACYKADIEQAYQAIDKTYTFITALWKATNREPSPTSGKVDI